MRKRAREREGESVRSRAIETERERQTDMIIHREQNDILIEPFIESNARPCGPP